MRTRAHAALIAAAALLLAAPIARGSAPGDQAVLGYDLGLTVCVADACYPTITYPLRVTAHACLAAAPAYADSLIASVVALRQVPAALVAIRGDCFVVLGDRRV